MWRRWRKGRRMIDNDSPWFFDPLPLRRYRLIMIDPPWKFVTRSEKGEGRSPQSHYRCMSRDEIRAMPVGELAAPNCWLWLWTTAAFQSFAHEVLEDWGFKYATSGVWHKLTKTGRKTAFGTGYVLRNSHEPILIGKRGRPRVCSRSVRSVIVAPQREHSRKPDEAYENAVKLAGDVPRLDVFSREMRSGWDVWGDQSGKFDRRSDGRFLAPMVSVGADGLDLTQPSFGINENHPATSSWPRRNAGPLFELEGNNMARGAA